MFHRKQNCCEDAGLCVVLFDDSDGWSDELWWWFEGSVGDGSGVIFVDRWGEGEFILYVAGVLSSIATSIIATTIKLFFWEDNKFCSVTATKQ